MRTSAICLALVVLAIAAEASQAATFGPTRKLARTVGIGPQIQGVHLSWTDVELIVRPGEKVEWDWEADQPVRFYLVSPTGAIMASVDDESSSEGSAVMTEGGCCRAAWTNPSFRTPASLHFSVEVKEGGSRTEASGSPQDDWGTVLDGQWAPDVAVALLLLLACEVLVAVPMLVVRARGGPRLARKFPIDYTDAYLCLGPEMPSGIDGLPIGALAQPRSMEGALSVVRGARR